MLTPLSIAVLALLRERPMHPYEMRQVLVERHRDELVKINPGSLYHTVGRLERHGLLEQACTEREGNRPERTTYRVTTAGATAVEDWVRERLATPGPEYPAYPFALTEAHNLAVPDVLAALERRIDELSDHLARVDQTLLDLPDTPEVYLLGAHHLAAMLRAECDWTRELVSRIERKDFAWHPQT